MATTALSPIRLATMHKMGTTPIVGVLCMAFLIAYPTGAVAQADGPPETIPPTRPPNHGGDVIGAPRKIKGFGPMKVRLLGGPYVETGGSLLGSSEVLIADTRHYRYESGSDVWWWTVSIVDGDQAVSWSGDEPIRPEPEWRMPWIGLQHLLGFCSHWREAYGLPDEMPPDSSVLVEGKTYDIFTIPLKRDQVIHLFVDRQSGLLVREQGARRFGGKLFQYSRRFSDPKEVDGVMLAHRIVVIQKDRLEMELRIGSIERNAEIPDDAFVPRRK